jgi:GntR family transcriptional regulator
MEILAGNFKTDEKIYSQYQLAEMFVINPATAAKGLNMLVDENILYKKRGLGMFVSPNGKAVILEKRKSQTLKKIILEMLTEAERLGVDDEELIQMINILRNQSREE